MLVADRIFLILMLILCAVSGVLLVFNYCDFHYDLPRRFFLYFSVKNTTAFFIEIIVGFVFLLMMMIRRARHQGASEIFWWGIALFAWSLCACALMAEAIQSTPFSPIDTDLLKLDRMLGVNTIAIMQWTFSHPFLCRVLGTEYGTMGAQLLLIPLLITTVFHRQKEAEVFYIANMSAILVGFMIYYFFPTISPAGVLQSHYFLPEEKNLPLLFYQIHHHIKITAQTEGLIAFPSFHVIWAILLTYVCRSLSKLIFYPVLCMNILLVLATVMLGFHYMTDVLAGAVLATGSIFFARVVVFREY